VRILPYGVCFWLFDDPSFVLEEVMPEMSYFFVAAAVYGVFHNIKEEFPNDQQPDREKG
jgi:hypothetical protein